MCPISSVLPWLDSHQYLALWLEGLALLVIFIWDRIDASQQHKQTLEQMKIMRDQALETEKAANAASKSAEALINSERAWVVAELVPICARFGGTWHRPSGVSWVSMSPAETLEGDHLMHKFKLTNMGQTPAHILRYSIGYLREVDTEGAELRMIEPLSRPEIEFDRLISGNDSIEVTTVDVAEHIRSRITEIGDSNATGIVSGLVKYQHVFSDTAVVEVRFAYFYDPSSGSLRKIPMRKPDKEKANEQTKN